MVRILVARLPHSHCYAIDSLAATRNVRRGAERQLRNSPVRTQILVINLTQTASESTMSSGFRLEPRRTMVRQPAPLL